MLVQVAKGNITYTLCPKESIHDEILKRTGTCSTLSPPDSTYKPYVPAKNSVSGMHHHPGSDSSGSRGVMSTIGNCDSHSNSNSGNSNSTSEAINHVMYGTSQKSSTVGRKGNGNNLNSGPESVIWVSVCSLYEKHGVDYKGRALPLESLGILRGVLPVGIGLPSVAGDEDMSRVGGGKGDASNRGAPESSYGGKRKGEDVSTVKPGAMVGMLDRDRDREGNRGRAVAGAGGAAPLSVSSLADTWRAAGFPYGAQEAGILQAHVSFAGSEKLLTYPSDKVGVNCIVNCSNQIVNLSFFREMSRECLLLVMFI
jgi:hypothetical protein